jgi:hypothetical protein
MHDWSIAGVRSERGPKKTPSAHSPGKAIAKQIRGTLCRLTHQIAPDFQDEHGAQENYCQTLSTTQIAGTGFSPLDAPELHHDKRPRLSPSSIYGLCAHRCPGDVIRHIPAGWSLTSRFVVFDLRYLKSQHECEPNRIARILAKVGQIRTSYFPRAVKKQAKFRLKGKLAQFSINRNRISCGERGSHAMTLDGTHTGP